MLGVVKGSITLTNGKDSAITVPGAYVPRDFFQKG